VLLEGSRFLYFPVKPNFSGYISSGAIHRIVPLISRLSAVLPAVDPSMTTASPKSAKRARQLESTRTLTYSYLVLESTACSVQLAHPLEISVHDVMLV
jgi:3-deoxy-D-manno-octulosonic-acid transferase